ncbi:MAG: cytochrome d ubiquinol oxidase subunit II [Syntrophaceae bacterium]
MEFLESNVVLIWFLIIAFSLIYYAVADGFDLGIGIISLASHNERERGIMMGSLQSLWQDNQTWLVVMGGMLFGAFPIFYGLVLSSLYIPIFVMLFGLILRGVSFEFRLHSKRKRLWGVCFGAGSLIATLAQGFAIGTVFYGLNIVNGKFLGSVLDWVNPFAGLTAAGLLFGYVTLGANFLIIKTENVVQAKSYRIAEFSSALMIIAGAGIVIWLNFRHNYVARKWSMLPEALIMSVIIALILVSMFLFFRSLSRRLVNAPFLWNVAMVILAFAGVSFGFYPFMIPNVVTIHYAAASSPKTLLFMLIVTAILIPVILAYTAYKYRVFRGKTEGDSELE